MAAMTRDAEEQLLQVMRDRLYVAVVSDVLDSLGYMDQAMDVRVRPIDPGMRLAGRAHTCLSADVYEKMDDPYRLEIEAIDTLKPGDVMVASTNESTRTCFWGELLTTAAMARGAVGCVIDGYARDALTIAKMGFPLFCTGFKPVDSGPRSTVVMVDCPVMCGGVLVHPGDIVFADFDGIVVVPKDALAEVVERAIAKVDGENRARDLLREGALLRDVYDRFGIL